ncbi:MAG: hypothetical protein E7314_06315 [Clostridiales bacterium]|nr:hypothetical protein [Clostridiales bacterium]
MGINMTKEQRKVFDEGVKFSFELLKTYVEKHWTGECQTFEERRTFIFDIWNFIDSLKGNFGLYEKIDKFEKEKNISEGDRFFFENGISEHIEYVKFCTLQDDFASIVEHITAYLTGNIESLPNKKYKTFEDWINA